jgi:chromosome segregation ATPase
MLSSPPAPAPPPHRTPHGDEPDQTQYSLDLDALNLDDEPSALDSPSVQRVVDKIHSDDIDGPTDFTVNLAKYFKGTPRKQPLPAWEEREDLFDETNADFLTNSSPNRSPVFDRSTQSESGANDPTPRPDQGAFQDPRKNIPQPTVEDYYSELTPGRPTSVNLPQNSAQRRSYSTSRLRHSQNQRPSSPPTIQSMQSPMSHFDSTPNQKPHSLYQELQKLRALNESLQTQLDTERASHQYQRPDRSQSRGRSEDGDEWESLRNELNRMREESRSYQSRMQELRSDLDQSKANERDAVKLAEDRAKELDQMHDSEDAEIHNLQVQLGQARDAERQTHTSFDKVKDELKSKDSLLADVRSQLKQSQNNLRETENDMQELKTWNEDQHRAKTNELERVQRELSDARKDLQQAKDDHEEDTAVNLSKVDVDDEPLISQKQADSTSQSQAELERQIASLQAQLDEMRQAVDTKEKLIADLKSQIKNDLTSDNLKRQLQEAHDALEAKEKAVQAAHEDADTKAADMTRELAQQLQQAKQRLAAYEAEGNHVKADALLEQLEAQLQKARDDLNSALQQHASDKHAWARADSEAQQSQGNANNQLKKEQEARKKAEEDVRSLREELEMLQHFNRIEDKSSASKPDFSTRHLADSLRKDLQALRSQLESQQKQHHEEVERLRESWGSPPPQSDSATLQVVRAEHQRTIDLIEEGMASLRTSRDTLSLRNNELSATLSTAQSELQTTANSLTLAEADLTAKTSELESLASSSQELDQKLAATTAELADTKAELSDLHALNLDFDTKLSATLGKREESWRAKVKALKEEVSRQKEGIAELESERKGMVKALMGFWGREEFGGDEEYDFVDGEERESKGIGKEGKSQKFRYRFAGR